uniref:Uncharacterized protein n=1 Tax=uncultured marine virus TaxID=186617 RepID=A0A0F7L6Y2_9VIRU|nr:hypothetical protein [uncultured marine virus]
MEMSDKIIVFLAIFGLSLIGAGFFMQHHDKPCQKIVYELRGEVAFARDCNGGEWRSIPPRYGTYRVYQVGEEL